MLMTYLTRTIYVCHNYAIGIAEFQRLNPFESDNLRDTVSTSIKVTMDEVDEMVDEIKAGEWTRAFFEMADVLHSIAVSLILILLPRKWIEAPWIWYVVFVASGIITPMKHGERFIRHGCVRSEKNCASGKHRCRSSMNPNSTLNREKEE
jgi:hypothetical protein